MRLKTQGKRDKNAPVSLNNIVVWSFHSLAIEKRKGKGRKWKSTTVMDNRLLEQFGRNASVSEIHHFDSANKSAIVRVAFEKPVRRGAVAGYSWIELDLENSKVKRVISNETRLPEDFLPARSRVVVVRQ